MFNTTYNKLKDKFEKFLEENIAFQCVPSPLKDAMQYAMQGKGKRIRPVLFLYSYSIQKGDIDNVALTFALALEVLHNYSLVHDDLPCMDNDDYRRGRLTVHKVYGEDIATLCGDALLNYAYELVAKGILLAQDKDSAIKCFELFAKLSGAMGMIGGQTADINPNKSLDNETLNYIYKNKTCNLFRYALQGGAILGGSSGEIEGEFGNVLGYIFQLTDDLLDNDDDFSILKIMSKTNAKVLLEEKTKIALSLAEKIDKEGFLTSLVNNVVNRKN